MIRQMSILQILWGLPEVAGIVQVQEEITSKGTRVS